MPDILLSHSDHKILVVEDDRTLREALRYNLVAAGYEVVVASDGGEGLVSARQNSPDVVVLDLMLPSLSGMEVCKALRRDGSILPIIMLTARDSEIDRIGGLESGADDYVTKPFSMRELIARVTAQIRRMQMIKSISQNATDEILDLGELVINRASRNVTLNGKSVDLRRNSYIHSKFRYFLVNSRFPSEYHPKTIELREDIAFFA